MLILSRPEDGHIERLQAELNQPGALWIILDPGAFPGRVDVISRVDQDMQTGLTLPDGQPLLLEAIDSVWYRRPSPIKADQHLPALQQTFIEREARAGLWGMLRSIDGLWVNHPGANSEAAYKPHQLALARRLGLEIPRTLLTSNPAAFRRFYEECQSNVIYKLPGFPAYEVEDDAIASTYTSRVPETLLKEAHRISATAHLFQEFQEKIFDLRVIIIGQKAFAVEIYPLFPSLSIKWMQRENRMFALLTESETRTTLAIEQQAGQMEVTLKDGNPLWLAIVQAYEEWVTLGRPGREHYTLVIGSDACVMRVVAPGMVRVLEVAWPGDAAPAF